MGGKKKKKKRPTVHAAHPEQDDELVALAAIYESDFHPKDKDGAYDEFIIHLVPFPGDQEANTISVDLVVKYGPSYPRKAPLLRLVPGGKGHTLSHAQRSELEQILDVQAAAMARTNQVMIFNLAETVREYMVEHMPELSTAVGGQSLWAAMQQREQQRAHHDSPTTSYAQWTDAVDIGLFGGDDEEAEEPSPLRRLSMPQGRRVVAHERSRSATSSGRLPQVPHESLLVTTESRASALALSPVESVLTSAEGSNTTESNQAGEGWGGEPGSSSRFMDTIVAQEAQVLLAFGRDSATGGGHGRPAQGTTPHVEAAHSDIDDSKPASSAESSTASEARDAEEEEGVVEALLSKGEPLHSGDGTGGGGSTGEQGPGGGRWIKREATRRLQRELVVGRMMALLCEPCGPLPHALPALAGQLASLGLIPSWLKDVLVSQPAMLARAFAKAFGAVAAALQQTPRARSDADDPRTRWALLRFWQQCSVLAPLTGAEERGGMGATTAPAPPASRYLSDFQELRVLGQGGFGQVVLATNRLDGRKYAIKKIKMSAQNPKLNSKILREVATLSRLQHGSIVRYFQAWCEAGSAMRRWVAASNDEKSDERDDLSCLTHSDTLNPTRISLPQARLPRVLSWEALSADDDDTSDIGTSYTSRKEWGMDNDAGGSSNSGTCSRHGGGDSGGVFPQQYLYIQMEYCPRTLRECMDDSAFMPELGDFWARLRQILEGLRHIHSQGIIHRDLKPSNLFIDARGAIKIGDFGLAKFKASVDIQSSLTTYSPKVGEQHTPHVVSESTGVVGTKLYTAPEIEQGLPHDSKVDMWSLGIIGFEMLTRFSTCMERVVVLGELRAHHTLPPSFLTAHPLDSPVARLLRWLLEPDPAQRPSASEVLRSELMPPRIEDELLTDLLRSIPDDPSTTDRVLERLFPPRSSEAEGTYLGTDHTPAGGAGMALLAPACAPRSVHVRDKLLHQVKEIFQRHGATAIESRLVEHASQQHAGSLRVMDAAGTMLALRYNLRHRLARWAGETQLQLLRCSEVANVCRDANGRALPQELWQADFDLVSPVDGSLEATILADAEVIKVASEVLELVPDTTYEVRLSHRDILSVVWHYAGVPPALRTRVGQVVQWASAGGPEAAAERWATARRQLMDGIGLAAAAVERLEALARCAGEAHGAMGRLRVALPGSGTLSRALEALQLLLRFLRCWGVAGAVTLHPLMPPHDPFLSGVFFQMYIGQEASGGGSSLCPVAAGGRYDALLAHYWRLRTSGELTPLPQEAVVDPPAPGGSGVSLAVDKLEAALKRAPGAPPTATGVFVCSKGGGGLLHQRMELMAELWEANVWAEMLPQANPSMTDQYSYAHGVPGLRWLVVLNEASLAASGTVTVKDLSGRTEEHFPRDEVVRYLSTLLLNRRHPEVPPGRQPSLGWSHAHALEDAADATGGSSGAGSPLMADDQPARSRDHRKQSKRRQA